MGTKGEEGGVYKVTDTTRGEHMMSINDYNQR